VAWASARRVETHLDARRFEINLQRASRRVSTRQAEARATKT